VTVTPPALLFTGSGSGLDYGRRLARLRWRRTFADAEVFEAEASQPAAEVLARATAWIAVRDETALPLPGAHV
jgi:hypothetical protein